MQQKKLVESDRLVSYIFSLSDPPRLWKYPYNHSNLSLAISLVNKENKDHEIIKKYFD